MYQRLAQDYEQVKAEQGSQPDLELLDKEIYMQLCLQLAKGDAMQAIEYFENWEIVKVYEWLAVELARNYKPIRKA